MTKTQRVGSAVALATVIAVPAEGLRTWAYEDLANPKLLTVCWGHTGHVDRHREYTMDECKALLDSDMRQAVERVEACHPGLPVPVLAAMSDLVFNVGPDSVCNTGKWSIARNLAAGRLKEACLGLGDWNKARILGVLTPLPGLTKRRAAETQLCLEGVNDGQDPELVQ